MIGFMSVEEHQRGQDANFSHEPNDRGIMQQVVILETNEEFLRPQVFQ